MTQLLLSSEDFFNTLIPTRWGNSIVRSLFNDAVPYLLIILKLFFSWNVSQRVFNRKV